MRVDGVVGRFVVIYCRVGSMNVSEVVMRDFVAAVRC